MNCKTRASEYTGPQPFPVAGSRHPYPPCPAPLRLTSCAAQDRETGGFAQTSLCQLYLTI